MKSGFRESTSALMRLPSLGRTMQPGHPSRWRCTISGSKLLPAGWAVPPIFRNRLGDEVGRQRLMASDGHLLLVLHAPPSADDDERTGRFFWRDPEGTWRASIQGSGIAALTGHLQEFEAQLEALELREQNATGARHYFDILRALTPLHRASRNLHSVLQKAREANSDDSRIIRWRDEAYGIERTAELLLGETRHGLDFVTAMRAEEQAVEAQNMTVASHRLNVLAALFFPLATIASLLGMNVPSGLEDSPAPWTFLGILAIGAIIGVGVKTSLDAGAKS